MTEEQKQACADMVYYQALMYGAKAYTRWYTPGTVAHDAASAAYDLAAEKFKVSREKYRALRS